MNTLHKESNQFHLELGHHLHPASNLNITATVAAAAAAHFSDSSRRGFVASRNAAGEWVAGLVSGGAAPYLIFQNEAHEAAYGASALASEVVPLAKSRRAGICLDQPLMFLTDEYDTANTYLRNQFLTAAADGKFTNMAGATPVTPNYYTGSANAPVVGVVLDPPTPVTNPMSVTLLRVLSKWIPGETPLA